MNAEKLKHYLVSGILLLGLIGLSIVFFNATHTAKTSIDELNDKVSLFEDTFIKNAEDSIKMLGDYVDSLKVVNEDQVELILEMEEIVEILEQDVELAKAETQIAKDSFANAKELNRKIIAENRRIRKDLNDKLKLISKLKKQIEEMLSKQPLPMDSTNLAPIELSTNNDETENEDFINLLSQTKVKILNVELIKRNQNTTNKISKKNWLNTKFTLEISSPNLAFFEQKHLGIQIVNSTKEELLVPGEENNGNQGSKFKIVKCVGGKLIGHYPNWEEKNHKDDYEIRVFYFPEGNTSESYPISLEDPRIIKQGYLLSDFVEW